MRSLQFPSQSPFERWGMGIHLTFQSTEIVAFVLKIWANEALFNFTWRSLRPVRLISNAIGNNLERSVHDFWMTRGKIVRSFSSNLFAFAHSVCHFNTERFMIGHNGRRWNNAGTIWMHKGEFNLNEFQWNIVYGFPFGSTAQFGYFHCWTVNFTHVSYYINFAICTISI